MTGTLVQWGEPSSDVEDVADVVVIGSGAAGATAARVLTEAGLDVIVVEEGPHVPTEELRSDMYTSFKWLWRDMGLQVSQGRAFTPILQGRCVGGTTVVNGAIIHRMPKKVFDVWCEEHGEGGVLRYTELDRIWNQLDDELGVGPAPDEKMGRNNLLMQKGVEGLGLSGNRILRNVRDCQGSAHCNQGCPTGRKQSMQTTYIPRAIERGARVYATCRAEKLIVESGRAGGVRGVFIHPLTGERGPELIARARGAVVLAASAIQSPLLLADNGIGRRSGLVGQRLQCHPGAGVVGVFDDPVNSWVGATQGYETTHFWEERMKFEAVAMPLEFGAARLPEIGPDLMRRLSQYGHLAIWGVQVRAETEGSVRRNFFGAPTIHYDLGDQDIRRLKTGIRRLTEFLFESGAREVLPGVHGLPERISSVDELDPIFQLSDDPRRFHCIAAHLFGTAVLGLGPNNSVVAPTCEAHDLPGLYVTDSSVFPTNLGVNPQHTICAVSWLASEGIADRLAGR